MPDTQQSGAARCKEMVCPRTTYGAVNKYQCSRKTWRDGYCKQHHPDTVAKRGAESTARYEAQRKKTPLYKLREANHTIERLAEERDALAAALARITRLAECTCVDGGEGFVCDTCEARALLAKIEESKA